jgi:hypothetical protein
MSTFDLKIYLIRSLTRLHSNLTEETVYMSSKIYINFQINNETQSVFLIEIRYYFCRFNAKFTKIKNVFKMKNKKMILDSQTK